MLRILVDYIDNNNYDAVYSNYSYICADGSKGVRKLEKMIPNDLYKGMLNKQYIPHGGTLWKKNKKPYYDETLESAQDWELCLTALESGVRFGHVKQVLWTIRMGHARETGTEIEEDCCNRTLLKRGYYFDKIKREGFPII
jgi:hypothetical protein